MCVIAGYIGNEPAAPVLLEMLRREEGLAGGFYTGIATVHEGRLHYEKVVGDVETLIANTPALQLPGTIGVAHGRTPSGGGREYAHPFVDMTGELAYIANGARGQFADTTDLAALGSRLLQKGHRFHSAQPEPVGTSPVLSDGSTVHISDVMCQAIADAFSSSGGGAEGLLQAALEMYQQYPGEIVGLCLHAQFLDEIVAVRHNKPLEIARDDAGAIYLATTALAFPDRVNRPMRMPPLAGAIFHRDGSLRIVPFEREIIPLGDFPSPARIEEALGAALRQAPQNIHQLCAAVAPLWAPGTLNEKEIVVFETLASLRDERRIALETRRVPGMNGQGTVPRVWVRWC